MSQLAERFVSTGQPGGARCVLCRFVAVRLRGYSWHEPYKSRDLRTVLWAAGGAIPPADPARRVVKNSSVVKTRCVWFAWDKSAGCLMTGRTATGVEGA